MPPQQLWPPAHAIAQSPQWLGSDASSTQSPGHTSGSLAGQPQMLFTHTPFVRHGVASQPPQCAGSVAVSTQAGGHASGRLAGQPQMLFTQTPFVRQGAASQPPQCFGSIEVSTHGEVPPQSCTGAAAQTQARPAHVAVPGAPQEAPHAPQFWTSEVRSTQVAVPFTGQRSGVDAGQPHFPSVQEAPVAHVRVQNPQWNGSAARSTHVPPQRVWPAGQGGSFAGQPASTNARAAARPADPAALGLGGGEGGERTMARWYPGTHPASRCKRIRALAPWYLTNHGG